MWPSAGLSPARKAWHYGKPLTLDGRFTCPAPPWQHVASWVCPTLAARGIVAFPVVRTCVWVRMLVCVSPQCCCV